MSRGEHGIVSSVTTIGRAGITKSAKEVSKQKGKQKSMKNNLYKQQKMIQEQAEEGFDLLVEHMAKQERVTEQLKAQEQMPWVRYGLYCPLFL